MPCNPLLASRLCPYCGSVVSPLDLQIVTADRLLPIPERDQFALDNSANRGQRGVPARKWLPSASTHCMRSAYRQRRVSPSRMCSRRSVGAPSRRLGAPHGGAIYLQVGCDNAVIARAAHPFRHRSA